MEHLPSKIIAIHNALEKASLPHAFGGALALAWCTERARGTIDIDVNVFLPSADFATALSALPSDIKVTRKDRQLLKHDGQVRVWWEKTPVDLFLNSTPFHDKLSERVRIESFAGDRIPFLSCLDLAVFKAFFNRTKDWADLEEMSRVGTLDIDFVRGVLVEYLGKEDERVQQLQRLLPLA